MQNIFLERGSETEETLENLVMTYKKDIEDILMYLILHEVIKL